MTRPPTPSAVGLVATDLRRTLDFYRAVGLDIPSDADEAPHVEVVLTAGFRLMIDTVDTIHSFDPELVGADGVAPASLAFECDSPAGVDEAYAKVTAAGFEGHLEPFDAFWGQRYASLVDPDGTGVDLFAALPTASA